MNFNAINILSVVVVTSAQQMAMDYCSVVEIEKAKKECNDAYSGAHHDSLTNLCPNVECYLQCLEDAIGDCSNRDMFYNEDIEVYKALYRAKCANHTLSEVAMKVCQVQTPCIDDQFHKEQVDMLNKLANASDVIRTKQLECRLSAMSKSCITVVPDSSCTQEMAKLKDGIETVKNSLSQCAVTQEHPFFDQYGGDIKCTNPKVRSKCFTASVMSRFSKCTPVTLTTFLGQDKKLVEKICENVDCTSKCYSDAIEGCYNKDQFVVKDPEMIKVSTRATCDNIDDFASTIQQCKMRDMSCLHALGKSMTTAHMFLHEQRYKEYKNLICSATSKFRSCIVFDVSDNCTASMATLAKNLYEVWYTYSGCGQPDNTMFKTYSTELTCDTSGCDLHFSSFINIILLFIACRVYMDYE